jgi:homoserine O-acetyltransferase
MWEKVMSDYEVLELPNVILQRGGMLPAARLVYKTLGTLSPTRDNVVLVPTGYTQTHNHIESFMIGEGRALDPSKYFIVMANLLGNGLSSSPSNSPPPIERGRFPKVTIYDNVRLQQILVTQKLSIARIRLVTG